MTKDTIDKNKVQTKLLDRLNAALDVKPEVPSTKTKQEIQYDTDYEYTTNKLKELVEMGASTLEEARDVAIESGEARSFEVFATLLKNVGDLASGVLNASKTKSDIDKNSTNKSLPEATNMTQTNIFVGTTKDLAALAKNKGLEDLENE